MHSGAVKGVKGLLGIVLYARTHAHTNVDAGRPFTGFTPFTLSAAARVVVVRGRGKRYRIVDVLHARPTDRTTDSPTAPSTRAPRGATVQGRTHAHGSAFETRTDIPAENSSTNTGTDTPARRYA